MVNSLLDHIDNLVVSLIAVKMLSAVIPVVISVGLGFTFFQVLTVNQVMVHDPDPDVLDDEYAPGYTLA